MLLTIKDYFAFQLPYTRTLFSMTIGLISGSYKDTSLNDLADLGVVSGSSCQGKFGTCLGQR